MKSSSGQYFSSLDHIRAIAVFIVFVWHFNHFNDGHKGDPLIFPISILTEGHTGVAIFLVLSGYLFAKLLVGKKIKYNLFLWNRFLRLAPLLGVVILLITVKLWLQNLPVTGFLIDVSKGLILPTLPNGGWSITVEFHFYLILPILLFIAQKSVKKLALVIFLFLIFRSLLYFSLGEVQFLSYWTLIGRIDQFILGIVAFHLRHLIIGRTLGVALIAILFSFFWLFFDSIGGYYNVNGNNLNSLFWIFIPTIEAIVYGVLISWYDNSIKIRDGVFSKFIARIGTYSYSIYLLHYFLVFELPIVIHENLMDLSNPYLVLMISVPCFFLMLPISYLSHKVIEAPFLKYRRRYILTR